MSLEAALAKNTEAVDKNSALLEQLIARGDALKGGAASTAKPAAADKGATTAVTAEDCLAVAQPFLALEKTDPLLANRKTKMKALLAEFDVAKISELTPKQAVKFLPKVTKLVADVTAAEEGGDGEEEEDLA